MAEIPVIGPNFHNEVVAAGLSGLPFTWGSDGVNVADTRLTDEQKKSIQDLVKAHDPKKADPTVVYGEFIAAGVAVTSTGSAELNGVYAIDPEAQSNIAVEAQFITSFSEFTSGGVTLLPWTQKTGAVVLFPTTTSFMAFAKATAQLVAAAKVAVVREQPMPSPTIIIP